jgi:hypothetical protein
MFSSLGLQSYKFNPELSAFDTGKAKALLGLHRKWIYFFSLKNVDLKIYNTSYQQFKKE